MFSDLNGKHLKPCPPATGDPHSMAKNEGIEIFVFDHTYRNSLLAHRGETRWKESSMLNENFLKQEKSWEKKKDLFKFRLPKKTNSSGSPLKSQWWIRVGEFLQVPFLEPQ